VPIPTFVPLKENTVSLPANVPTGLLYCTAFNPAAAVPPAPKVLTGIHVPTPKLLLTITYPLLAPLFDKVKPVIRTVPVTSSILPGQAEPIPTLPPPLTIRLPPPTDHVPMPTLPLVTTNASCGVVVPTPTLPVNVADVPAAENVVVPDKVFTPLPLCAYPAVLVITLPELLIPAAVTTPADVTLNALAPTTSADVGIQVPIPTLPLVTVSAPCGVVVPIPTLPAPVS